MNRSNSRGTSKESGTLSTFDKLPRPVRIALRDANRDYNVLSLYERLNSGSITVKGLVKYIERRDLDVTREQAQDLWGADYPVDLIK